MTHEEIADNLLTPLWQGIDAGYKKRYALNIWQQFEDNIRSAAYTARASDFLSRIKMRLGITIYSEDVEKIAGVIVAGEDRSLLRMLREDTTLLVLLVRVANEARRAEWEKRMAEIKAVKQAGAVAAA